MKYYDLIFDLYGTLVDIHTDTDNSEVWVKTAVYFAYYGAIYTADELKASYGKVTQRMGEKTGQGYEEFPELQVEKIFAELFIQKGITENAQELGQNAAQFFRILSMQYIALYPGVKDALRGLRQDGHRLWLLSNAQHIYLSYELRMLGLRDYFDGIYISSDYGCKKPDSRFFDALIKAKALNPENCLMIGNDMATDIGGAQAVGLRTFYVHSNISPAQDIHAAQKADYSAASPDWFEILKMLRKICS